MLNGLLQGFGDFERDLVRAGARVVRDDERLADDEFRILETRHVLVGRPATRNRQRNDDDAQYGVLDGEFGDVHGAAQSMRWVGPGGRFGRIISTL